MDIALFRKAFWDKFGATRNVPEYVFWDPIDRLKEDACPEVDGMISIKKQRLLNLAFSFLQPDECYLEVGTYKGKSLISAMQNNPWRPVVACDNFVQFQALGNSREELRTNLARYGFEDHVIFYDCDFREVYTAERLPHPVGLYFYDGAHDYQAQYDA
ncbi:MAG: class I SAM-dependent methyltransferase, partial [Candidatus Hydrogenedentes bacterium]|nr:class I SAM-dependent methyltransferase [Candidatus Hydrogenedentota bacterium]